MDTFHLTKKTETGTLEWIYTSRIEAWTVDDWTRNTTVHLNHHDLVSYVSFNKKKNVFHSTQQKKSHIEMIECGWSDIHCLQEQFSHFSSNNQIS